MALIQCFLIAEPNWNLFVAAVAKASKRAQKLGMSPITWELAPEFEELCADSPVPVKPIALMGDIPETNDWRLVGRLEHLPDSQEALMTGEVPGHLRHEGPVCDHCQTQRMRNLTYILRFGNGKAYKRVGKSCLGEFLQTDAGEKLAKYFELLTNVMETIKALRDYEPSGSSPLIRYFTPPHVLTLAAKLIRTEGWLSVADAERTGEPSTASKVFHRIDEPLQPTEEDTQTVEKVLTWLTSSEVATAALESEYLHNLSAMVIAGSVPGHKLGLMASAVKAWQRAAEKRHEEVVSQFVGELGKRCEFTLTLVRTMDLYSEWGSKVLHSFVDEAGNKLVWFATGYSPFRIGQTYHVAARVEKHELYKDAFQTALSRVTCLDLKLLDVAAKGDVKSLKKLLAKGLDVNVRDPKNQRPLHAAVENNQEGATAILLDSHAIPDLKDRYGYAPLHIAVSKGFVPLVKLLLDSGATVEPDMFELVPPEATAIQSLLASQQAPH